MDNNVYSIVDLDNYAVSVRDSVAKSFTENYEDNLDEYISLNEVKTVIIGHSLGQDDDGLYLINEEVFNDTFEDIREWMLDVGLAKLAAQDLVECAWDDELNQMVFWAKNNDEQSNRSNQNGDR